MVDGIGQPPSGGSRITVGFFPMRKLDITSRTPGQSRRYRDLMSQISANHGLPSPVLLAKITDPGKLKDFITQEVARFFSPQAVAVLGKEDPSPFNTLKRIALEENRLIYLPDRAGGRVYVSGQTEVDMLDIFEATPQQFELSPQMLPPPYQSAVIVPLVGGLPQPGPLVEKPRYGAIVAAKTAANGFDPLVDLLALRIIGDNLAAVIKFNNTII